MARTITALFDTRADAEAGGERLRQAGVDASNVHVHDQGTHKTSGDYSTHEDRGLWASIKHAFLPDQDRHTYEEGIRRGGFLLIADVDDDRTSTAVDALENANSVDLDARSQQWREDGWDYPATQVGAFGRVDGADEQYGIRDPEYDGSRYRSYAAGTARRTDEF